jgi:nucleotide-binding universal stress UspA family protein
MIKRGKEMANTHPPPPFHILLADDGSRHAQSAIELIKCLPLTSGSEIHAVTVFTPRQISEHERLRAHVLKSQESLLGADIDVSANLVLGYPAEKIIEISEDTKPNLIVIGAKGLRATMGILLGGVAQQVVEYAKSPVLVVRAPFEQLDNILLVTDGSICSEYAASYLTKLPLPHSANIRIMHVLPPVPVYTPIAKTWPIGPELLEMTTPDWSEDIETWKRAARFWRPQTASWQTWKFRSRQS